MQNSYVRSIFKIHKIILYICWFLLVPVDSTCTCKPMGCNVIFLKHSSSWLLVLPLFLTKGPIGVICRATNLPPIGLIVFDWLFLTNRLVGGVAKLPPQLIWLFSTDNHRGCVCELTFLYPYCLGYVKLTLLLSVDPACPCVRPQPASRCDSLGCVVWPSSGISAGLL